MVIGVADGADANPLSVVDSDGDGVGDDWEQHYFGDLSQDGTLDSDGDGLTDAQEFELRADPWNIDSDRDGVSDADEVNAGASPVQRDSDGDGVADGVDAHPALNFDSDGDDLGDDWELYHFGGFGADRCGGC